MKITPCVACILHVAEREMFAGLGLPQPADRDPWWVDSIRSS